MSNSVANTLISLVKTEAEAAQVLSVAQASPEGEIILDALHEKVMSHVDSLLDGFIEVTLKENPTASVDDVVSIVDGDIWHYERLKLGFFGFSVDVLRNIPKYADPVLAEVRARYSADEPSIPASPVLAAPEISATPAVVPVLLETAETAALPAITEELTKEHVPAAEQPEIVAVAETEISKPGFLQTAEDLIHRAEDTLHITHN